MSVSARPVKRKQTKTNKAGLSLSFFLSLSIYIVYNDGDNNNNNNPPFLSSFLVLLRKEKEEGKSEKEGKLPLPARPFREYLWRIDLVLVSTGAAIK